MSSTESDTKRYDLLAHVYKGTEGMLMKTAYRMAGIAYDRLITVLLIKNIGKLEEEVGQVS